VSVAKTIDIKKYWYSLPEEFIAKYPLPDREQSRLLVYNEGAVSQHIFEELPELVSEKSWFVFNNTRVIQARMEFRKPTGARIEIFCIEPVDPVDYQLALQATDSCLWKCMVGNARKWKEGIVFMHSRTGGMDVVVEAEMIASSGDNFLIRFSWNRNSCSFGEIVENSGTTPIPPYLNRKAEKSDKERYQTIYSRPSGSVAAPTAGLHFTRRMLDQVKEKGIRTAELTLHVGAGTFVPVKVANARHHSMHAERVSVSRIFLQNWAEKPDGLIAIGTTTTRSLESLYWLGVKLSKGEPLDPGRIHLDQWDNEKLPADVPLGTSLGALSRFCELHKLDCLQFSTQLMIVPGYRFRTIDGLVTNFHLPRSTLLLLISAFIGEDWKKVYTYAVENRFRFLSYGDSSLLIPRN
jgi:S-adenosylmethionine:tRNA ribosyltransferase-isomerase